MAIESVSSSALLTSQTVGHKANPIPKMTAESSAAIEPNKAPKPVPAAVKVDINTKPLVSSSELESKIIALNEALVSRNQGVAFSVDSSTGRDVVSVHNMSTGELIRQMPSVEVLKSMQNMDRMMGLIFNKEV